MTGRERILDESGFVAFICPSCGCEDDRLSDGVCPGCFYILTGGDQGTDVPTWQVWLEYGQRTAA